jgi:flavin reductase (DIM6/NTAB) family NADH-FMN oxidoreductase RutF
MNSQLESFSQQAINEMEIGFKVNLINSITGAKSANLIGTLDEQGIENLAVFSSVTHIGSSPALIGFFLRPNAEVKRDTFNNILNRGEYTINSIPRTLIKKAHTTARKYPAECSEFIECGIESTYLENIAVPFVKEAPIKIHLKLKQVVPIEANATKLVIGEVAKVFVHKSLLGTKGHIDLQAGQVVSIGGCDTYYELKQLDRFDYSMIGAGSF